MAEQSFKLKCNICKRECETKNIVERQQPECNGEYKLFMKNSNAYDRMKTKTIKENLRKENPLLVFNEEKIGKKDKF